MFRKRLFNDDDDDDDDNDEDYRKTNKDGKESERERERERQTAGDRQSERTSAELGCRILLVACS